MEWYVFPATIIAGLVAGFINTLAGSGSLITIALLIFLGLPANVANGTNRVGVLFQNAVSAWTFKQQDILDTKGALWLSIPATIGAIIGAQTANTLDQLTMERVIGGLMVFMLIVILVRPKRWLEGTKEIMGERPSLVSMVILFGVGFYGGFIQAGVGIFLLASLVLGIGYDLVRANAVKVLINLVFTVFALAVFVYNDQVNWSLGFLLAIGNAAGGWIAARMAVERGAEFVRWLLIAVVALSALQLLGIIDVVTRLFFS